MDDKIVSLKEHRAERERRTDPERAARCSGSGAASDDLAIVESFVAMLKQRPWLDPPWVNAIDHGLRMSLRGPDHALWPKLKPVILDDEMSVEQQLRQISGITSDHLRGGRAVPKAMVN